MNTKRPTLEEQKTTLAAKYKKKVEQINQKIKDKNAREKTKQRKIDKTLKQKQRQNDTRRKIIAGALALNHRDKNTEDAFSKKLDALINEYVTKDTERALFDLPPLTEHEQNKKRPD